MITSHSEGPVSKKNHTGDVKGREEEKIIRGDEMIDQERGTCRYDGAEQTYVWTEGARVFCARSRSRRTLREYYLTFNI